MLKFNRLEPASRRVAPMIYTGLILLAITGCGGGGGGGGGGPAPAGPVSVAQTDFERGVFSPSTNFKDMCAIPRSGGSFPDTQGTTEDENDWLRAWSNDLYLWYDEIIDEDPRDFTTPGYFDLMKTFAVTPSGADRDQFHFTFDTEEWVALSQSGVSAGYGAEFELISATVPRRIVVAFVEPGTPATDPAVALDRGHVIVEIDGVDVETGSDTDTLNAGLFPDAGETHTFLIEDFDGANQRTVTMTSAQLTQTPVLTDSVISTPAGPVGYVLFNSHIAPAEGELFDVMTDFEAAGIVDLVVDLRYNGGGFLDIANELAFMIAGPSAASGRTFDETQFNDKHPSINPVTGASLGPDAFHTTAQGFSVASGTVLPSVNLNRVFILSGPGTCSASEAIINGLRGIDVEVILIGETTCGKPYGFYATDNCGTTYFSIQFRGVNAKGFGDYADGFVPTQSPVEEYEVQGCEAPDDFSKQLGDVTEVRLATALDYMSSNTCNVPVVAINSRANSKSVDLETAQSVDVQSRQSNPLSKPVKMPGTLRR